MGGAVASRRIALVLLVAGTATLLLGLTGVAAADTTTDREELILVLPEADLEGEGEVIARLQAHAIRTQEPVLHELDAMAGVRVEETFWITNAILVSIDPAVASREDLADIAGVLRVDAHGSVSTAVVGGKSVDGTTYGIEMLNVPDVWTDFDARGAGVTVAVLDTGVDG